jgi:hypothetical protein
MLAEIGMYLANAVFVTGNGDVKTDVNAQYMTLTVQSRCDNPKEQNEATVHVDFSPPLSRAISDNIQTKDIENAYW